MGSSSVNGLKNNTSNYDAALNFEERLNAIGKVTYGHGIGEKDKGGKGNIGLVGNKIIKFNTKYLERKNLDENSLEFQDMKAHCDELRKALFDLSNDKEVIFDDENDRKALLDKLGIKGVDDEGEIVLKEDAGLLERTDTATVLKMLFAAHVAKGKADQAKMDSIWAGHAKTWGSSVSLFKEEVRKFNEQVAETTTNEAKGLVEGAIVDGLVRYGGRIAGDESKNRCKQLVSDRVYRKMPTYVQHLNKWYDRVCAFLRGVKPKGARDADAFLKMMRTIEASKANVENTLREAQNVVMAQTKLAPFVKQVMKLNKDVSDAESEEEKKAKLDEGCAELKKVMTQCDLRDSSGTVQPVSYWLNILDPDGVIENRAGGSLEPRDFDDFASGGFADKLSQAFKKGTKIQHQAFDNMCSYVENHFQIEGYGYHSDGFQNSYDKHYGAYERNLTEVVAKGVKLMKGHVDSMLNSLSKIKFSDGVSYPDFSKGDKEFGESMDKVPENVKPVCEDIWSAVKTFKSAADTFGSLFEDSFNAIDNKVDELEAKESLQESCKSFSTDCVPQLDQVLQKDIRDISDEDLKILSRSLHLMHNAVCIQGVTCGGFSSNICQTLGEEPPVINGLDDFKDFLKRIVRSTRDTRSGATTIFRSRNEPAKREEGVPYGAFVVNREWLAKQPDTNAAKVAINSTKLYFSKLYELAKKFEVLRKDDMLN